MSSGSIGFKLYAAPMRQGVQITVRDVPTADVYNWGTSSWENLETRVRRVLALSNVPDVTLKLNGRVVEPIFPARRGSPLPAQDARNWGPLTEVRVKSHLRKAGSGSGAFYVRLNGLYQFMTSADTPIPMDVTVDVNTRLRPQVIEPPYPFNVSRDAFNDRSAARTAYRETVREITREAASSARPREYDTLIGDEGDDREREGAQLVANELASVLEHPDVKAALGDLLGVAGEMYTAENARMHDPGDEDSEDIEDAPMGSPDKDPYEGFRGAIAAPKAGARKGLQQLGEAITAIVGQDQNALVAEGVRALVAGVVPSGDAIAEILTVVHAAPEAVAADPNRTGESPVAVAAAATQVSDTLMDLSQQVEVSPEAEVKIKKARAVSPFGSAAMVKISRIHFERAEARKFLKDVGRFLPLLAAWDITLRVIGAEAKIRIPFRPGFVLDDTVRGVCLSEGTVGSVKNFVLLHPLAGPLVLYFQRGGRSKVTPQRIAAYLHSVACHEMAHLPVIGHGGKPHGHDEAWAIQREDLGVATHHLLPALERAVTVALFPGKAAADVAVSKTPRGYKKLERELRATRSKLDALTRSQTPLHEVAEKLGRLAQYGDFRRFLQSAPAVQGRSGAEILAAIDRNPRALAEVMIEGPSRAVERVEAMRIGPFRSPVDWNGITPEARAAASTAVQRNLNAQACVARCLEASARKRYLTGETVALASKPSETRSAAFGTLLATAGQVALNEASAIAADASGCIAGCFTESVRDVAGDVYRNSRG